MSKPPKFLLAFMLSAGATALLSTTSSMASPAACPPVPPQTRITALHPLTWLNRSSNVVGLDVVRPGHLLYNMQDFGHALPTYSPLGVRNRVAAADQQKRRQSKRNDLPRRDLPNADSLACSMAKADNRG